MKSYTVPSSGTAREPSRKLRRLVDDGCAVRGGDGDLRVGHDIAHIGGNAQRSAGAALPRTSPATGPSASQLGQPNSFTVIFAPPRNLFINKPPAMQRSLSSALRHL